MTLDTEAPKNISCLSSVSDLGRCEGEAAGAGHKGGLAAQWCSPRRVSGHGQAAGSLNFCQVPWGQAFEKQLCAGDASRQQRLPQPQRFQRG